MTPFEKALGLILENTSPLGRITLPLSELSGKYLAEDIRTPFPLPRFDNSAMDGYAVRVADFRDASSTHPIALRIDGTIRAGESPVMSIKPGGAVKIMTGAPIPPEAEAVVIREDVESAEGLYCIRPVEPGANIRRRGEELPEGAVVLRAGTRVIPPVIGMLATLGLTSAVVHMPPRISVIVTGDELLQPGSDATESRIFDSNGPALLAAIKSLGICEVSLSNCPDNETTLKDMLSHSLRDSDIVITVGGISVGDYDLVRRVNESLSIREIFWRVAIKPGKPTYFGVTNSDSHRRVSVFGLPGNPVAALVTFELFVKTVIGKMMGRQSPEPSLETAVLGRTLSKKHERLEFLRGRYDRRDDREIVLPVSRQESHMLSGLVSADCLIMFPAGEHELTSGSEVKIINLNWDC